MARLKLSKASLQQERTKLKLYEKLLPSLELKRRQLAIELDKARKEYAATQLEVERLEARVGAELPMLAMTEIDLKGLVKMTAFDLEQENVVGVRLPLLKQVECQVAGAAHHAAGEPVREDPHPGDPEEHPAHPNLAG
jgi:V/A-type H+-transporting ATPase subunit D